jgi:hypothetical protein
MPVALDAEMRTAPNSVTESGEELDKERHWVGFGVRLDSQDEVSG